MAKSKEYDRDLIREHFLRLPNRNRQIEEYQDLGEFIHGLIEEDQKEAAKSMEKFKNGKKEEQ